MDDQQQKVYVLRQLTDVGDYLDGIFSSQENAEEFMKRFPHIGTIPDDPEIVEWTVDAGLSEIRSNLRIFSVVIWRDGFLHFRAPMNTQREVLDSVRSGPSLLPAQGQHGSRLWACVWATDADDAERQVHAIRTRMIESGEWPEDPPPAKIEANDARGQAPSWMASDLVHASSDQPTFFSDEFE